MVENGGKGRTHGSDEALIDSFFQHPKQPSLVEQVKKFEKLVYRTCSRTWKTVDALTWHQYNTCLLFMLFLVK